MSMDHNTNKINVQWERMLPYEFRTSIQQLPVVFLPLGTVEWHGEHNALGLDAVKAHALCINAAQKSGGGVVHPPVYGGMGGLDKPATVVMEGENSWENHLLRTWLEKLCYEFHRIGFRAIIILTGHYGHNQQILVRETAVRMSERLQIPVLGTAEYWLAQDAGYLGDHAGIGETSILTYLHPDLVCMDRIKDDPDYGQTDDIAKGSSKELGMKYSELISGRLADLAKKMICWDETKLASFIKSERAIVSAQVKGWRTDHPWAGFIKMMAGEITEYGKLLVEEKFEAIEKMAADLL